MLKIRNNVKLEQVKKELELVYSPFEVETISPIQALKEELITKDEYGYLRDYLYLIIGETTVFASLEGELFTELQSEE